MPALLAILGQPDVARWWRTGAFAPDLMRDELIRDDAFAIVVDEALSGWVGFLEETDPDYRHAALDIFLASAVQGRGHGPEALRLVVEHLVARGHHRFTLDPAAANHRAIRAYASVGFRPVGVMRSYERGADGTWHDGLLMELIATTTTTQR